jgi:hypothetical protein
LGILDARAQYGDQGRRDRKAIHICSFIRQVWWIFCARRQADETGKKESEHR